MESLWREIVSRLDAEEHFIIGAHLIVVHEQVAFEV